MNATTLLLAAAAAWVAIGVTAGLAMGRRGHDPYSWLLLGVVFGPLVIPLAVLSACEDRAGPHEVRVGEAGAGPVDVLVGLDGSDASEAALRAAMKLLGGRIGRLALATVLEHGATPSLRRDEERAVEMLSALASSIPRREAATAILRGDPAAALTKHATENGYGLLVVGRRGHGATKALLGSTATRLARSPDVPVLIV